MKSTNKAGKMQKARIHWSHNEKKHRLGRGTKEEGKKRKGEKGCRNLSHLEAGLEATQGII